MQATDAMSAGIVGLHRLSDEEIAEQERVALIVASKEHKCKRMFPYHNEHKPIDPGVIEAEKWTYMRLSNTVERCEAMEHMDNTIVYPAVGITPGMHEHKRWGIENTRAIHVKAHEVLREMLSKGNPLILMLLNGDRTLYDAALKALQEHEVACIKADESAMVTTKVKLDRYINLMYYGAT